MGRVMREGQQKTVALGGLGVDLEAVAGLAPLVRQVGGLEAVALEGLEEPLVEA